MEATPSSQAGLFDLAEQRLGWLDARQHVLAENVANIDTPGYRPRDVAPFETWLTRAGITPVRTNPLHLAGYEEPSTGQMPTVAESAPDGNAVGLETQLTRIADGETQQALVGNLWKSYMGMFMTALGHGS